jgi:prevent-host-death family protein
MQEFGAFEAKTHFSSLLEQVEKGEQIIITRHGRPIARLVPIGKKDAEKASATIERMKSFCKGNSLRGLDWKSLRDEGKK